MEEVLPILKAWWSELQSLRSLKSFRSRLVTKLTTRAAAAPLPAAGQLDPGAAGSIAQSDDEVGSAMRKLL
jgi:hypothetical protein